jgi:putative NADH-flavin reductase
MKVAITGATGNPGGILAQEIKFYRTNKEE